MRFFDCLTIGMLSASLSTGISYATEPRLATEQLQIPRCLLGVIPTHPVVVENAGYAIIDVKPDAIDAIMKKAYNSACGHPVNVTHALYGSPEQKREQARTLLEVPKKISLRSNAATYTIRHQDAVVRALDNIRSENILSTVEQLTRFTNRSATKIEGVQAASWLKQQFDDLVAVSGRKDTQSFFVKTGLRYAQPSLVTVIGKNIHAPAIVIGAHIDTLDGLMPGAGDDASGTASILEAARSLMQSDTVLKKPVYFIWYAAEERGLVGSQQVVKYFNTHAIAVEAAVQFDMTGFRNDPSDSTMWVYRDYTDPKLSDFTASLIATYLNVAVGESSCGYGCSDHASWMEKGVPAAFPCETDFEHHNQAIHSSEDTLDKLNLEHMTNFSKLALAFAIELAGA